MIKLTKGSEPSILKFNSASWTKILIEKLGRGEKPTPTEKGRYNHPEIKVALVAETHGKCAYCESKIRHATYGDIEHIVPKSFKPERSFDWLNLTLACDICNTEKSDYQGDHDNFIDPYVVDPEEHFWQMGATIHPKPGCDAAMKTEALLKLNRPELVERRSERLKALLKHLQVIEKIVDQDLRKILVNDFFDETRPEKEFSALAREVSRLAKIRLDLDVVETPPPAGSVVC